MRAKTYVVISLLFAVAFLLLWGVFGGGGRSARRQASSGADPRSAFGAPSTPTLRPSVNATPAVPRSKPEPAWIWWVDFFRDVAPTEYQDANNYVPITGFWTPCVCADWVYMVPDPKLQGAAQWIARFEANVAFRPGIWRFHLYGEGSTRFFIDDELVFEAWPSDRCHDEWIPAKFDQEGTHNLVFEVAPTSQGMARAHLSWEEYVRRPTSPPSETPAPIYTPTITPTPTEAVTPTPTFSPYQQPPKGSIVTAGQKITKGGLEIEIGALASTEMDQVIDHQDFLEHTYAESYFGFFILLTNKTDIPKTISYDPGVFHMRDDVGTEYEHHISGVQQFTVNPGETYEFGPRGKDEWDFGGTWPSTIRYLQDSMFVGPINPKAHKLYFSIDFIAGMEELIWVYELY